MAHTIPQFYSTWSVTCLNLNIQNTGFSQFYLNRRKLSWNIFKWVIFILCWKEGSVHIKENQLNTPLIVLRWMAFDWIDDICIEVAPTSLNCCIQCTLYLLFTFKGFNSLAQIKRAHQFLLNGYTTTTTAFHSMSSSDKFDLNIKASRHLDSTKSFWI